MIRLPLVLGLAQLLSRVPLPGSAPRPAWLRAFAHPERDKRVAVAVVALTALMVSTSLAWTGRVAPPGTFGALPQYWQEAADWLRTHHAATPTPGRVLVVPGAPFATQVWGTSHDEPLQVLGDGPWGVRDSIPLTPPQTIRALDSVQRLFAAGRPSAGLADTLARQGISYVLVRNDLDPETSRSARPILLHRSIAGSPGLAKLAEFGAPVGPDPLAGFVNDSGLRPRYPAIEIYRVSAPANPGAPYFAATDQLARVDGGPEVLLRLDERRRLQGQPPLGPVLMTADARAAGLPVPQVAVTDTPVARETDYGRVDHHSSAIRAPGDARHTYNRVPDYPVPGAEPVVGGWTGGRITVSSSSADATAMPDVAPASAPAAAVDGDPATAWVSNALQAAVGQWLQVDFDRPVTNAVVTLTPSATAVGAQVRRILIETVNGSTTLRFDEAGKPLTAALPYGETPLGAVYRGRHRRRVGRCAVRHHRSGHHPIRCVRFRPSGSAATHRAGARAAAGFGDRGLGPGIRTAGQTGLRPGTRRRALRRLDGPGTRGTGQSQPHTDRTPPGVGDPDGVGATTAGPEAGRLDRRAFHHPGQR